MSSIEIALSSKNHLNRQSKECKILNLLLLLDNNQQSLLNVNTILRVNVFDT